MQIQSLTTGQNLPMVMQDTPMVATFTSALQVTPSTRATYQRAMNVFVCWNKVNNVQNLDKSTIVSFIDDCLAKGLKVSTINGYIVALRAFFSWCDDNNIYQNIARNVKVLKKERMFKQHCTTTMVQGMLANANDRDNAIIRLMSQCGLRCIEIQRANIGDLQHIGDTLVLYVQGKGHNEKDDFVCIPESVAESLHTYIGAHRKGAKDSEPLFVSGSNHNGNGRLTTRSISRICKTALRAIGVDDNQHTAHSLRHTAAVTLLQKGATLPQVQQVLRHTSIDTTRIYTKSIEVETRLANPVEYLLNDMA